MQNRICAAVAAIAMTSAVTTPAFAGGIEDVLLNQNSARAGIYLSIPFTGGLKATRDTDLQYGFSVGVTRHYTLGTNLMDQRYQFNADVMKLRFNSHGFDNLAFGGQDVITYSNGQLGLFRNDDGTPNWLNIGIGVVGAGLIVWGIIEISKDDTTP